MGEGSSKLNNLRKALKQNSANVAEVELDGVQLSDKAVRRLSDSLRGNR